MPKFSKGKMIILNICFVVIGVFIVTFLLRAPKATTSTLPHDELHEEFFAIESKKEAEKNCVSCHVEGGSSPLSENHPPKYRCLFCHKRD
ncbi:MULTISPECIES: hypothetical protein [Desulfosediminicola]|uniref:hypothetical protein n=1 Tax=Desulfosediminicola TaxID=2886823 RepID=UPI0010AC522C|nr:hypothetical protein [Desulfosediminicola ganghwensis]